MSGGLIDVFWTESSAGGNTEKEAVYKPTGELVAQYTFPSPTSASPATAIPLGNGGTLHAYVIISGNATTVSQTLHLTSYDGNQQPGAISLDVDTVSGPPFNISTNPVFPPVIANVSLSMSGGLIDVFWTESSAGGNTEKEAVYKPTGELVAEYTFPSPTSASPATAITLEPHIDIYVTENGNGAGTLAWSLDGIAQGHAVPIFYDPSLPVPTGDWNALFRTNASQSGPTGGGVIELDQSDGSSDFPDRTQIQIHNGISSSAALGCIVGPHSSLDPLIEYLNSIYLASTQMTTLQGTDQVTTPTQYETVGANNVPRLTATPMNSGTIETQFLVQGIEPSITVHVIGAEQPHLALFAGTVGDSTDSISRGSTEQFIIDITGTSTGFQDRDILVHVKAAGLTAGESITDSAGKRIQIDKNGEFIVTVTRTSNEASFRLTTTPKTTPGNVSFSLIGYEEQRYKLSNGAPHGPLATPSGQVLLNDNNATASVTVTAPSAASNQLIQAMASFDANPSTSTPIGATLPSDSIGAFLLAPTTHPHV
jgi:hypothetical protein